jgi:8-oxo-dGTP pyrophosphatase MutT (NUDIX family)
MERRLESTPDTSQELLDVLDGTGTVVGQATRERVHREGLSHRAVHVLVWHPDGRLLLQKRSRTKALCPGLWDTSVGGHVGAGEDSEEAARRECREEIGIPIPPGGLETLGRHLFDEDPSDPELVDSWGIVHPGPFFPDPVEVEAVAFFSGPQIDDLISRGETTPHFALQWRLDLRSRTCARP